MTESKHDDTSTYTGGYICPNCDQWVGDSQVHYCPGRVQWPYYTWLPTIADPDYSVLFERIAAALERIADRLDKEK